jgi:hypothetical protein
MQSPRPHAVASPSCSRLALMQSPRPHAVASPSCSRLALMQLLLMGKRELYLRQRIIAIMLESSKIAFVGAIPGHVATDSDGRSYVASIRQGGRLCRDLQTNSCLFVIHMFCPAIT